ncbi:LOW QUALITY PROTEIN: hypothetical protein CVT25_008597 [Psilocybe cyanescens]|uniref:Alpha-L-rhamnosidase six-hairpin glycosidase domain-containing protein n=1 Tax=Psilocybe cyanescens TaxID=93625 RepID=A0A409XNP4_PSICY|nr:LOW QUALITY PROTEIN: hypothetical protein CVT25_008597 [Psilocybe cyanescens]
MGQYERPAMITFFTKSSSWRTQNDEALFLSFNSLVVCSSSASAPNGPWDTFNLAPESKTVYPKAIHSSHGSVNNANPLVKNKGKAFYHRTALGCIGFWDRGLISLNSNNIPTKLSFSLSFTESPSFIRPSTSDDSSFPSANTTYDGVLRVDIPAKTGYWTQPASSLRGGFRYSTIVSNSASTITLSNVSCAISFVPHLEDMRDYSGCFYAKDPLSKDADFLTKLWYSGAYTVQTNTVALNSGRHVPFAPAGSWENDATLGVAGPIIVDGEQVNFMNVFYSLHGDAARRAVWPGDMGIAVPAQFVSTNDLVPTRNALSTMFAAINPKTGSLPESGPPLSQQGSDTYHAWSLIGTYNYYLFSGDTAWLENVWANYTKPWRFWRVDGTGLMDVTALRNWARQGGGGYNAEGNAILYKVLTTATDLAKYMNLTSLSSAWAQNATALKSKFNDAFWLESVGMYRDNQTTALCPQDANSFAVLFNLTTSEEQKKVVSENLERNWNEPAPPNFQIQSVLLLVGLSGLRFMDFDMMTMITDDDDDGYIFFSQSTLLEGFTANGSLVYRCNHGYNDDPAYTSHSHRWSSSPTPALTFYVLGLSLTAPQGKTWAIPSHIDGGLPAAEGGFDTNLGWFGVKWTALSSTSATESGGGDSSVERFSLSVDTPEGMSGVVTLPDAVDSKSYMVDGVRVGARASRITLTGGRDTIQI